MTRVFEAVRALALCHNVTPVYEDTDMQIDSPEADRDMEAKVVYQASSPDEVGLRIACLKL